MDQVHSEMLQMSQAETQGLYSKNISIQAFFLKMCMHIIDLLFCFFAEQTFYKKYFYAVKLVQSLKIALWYSNYINLYICNVIHAEQFGTVSQITPAHLCYMQPDLVPFISQITFLCLLENMQ